MGRPKGSKNAPNVGKTGPKTDILPGKFTSAQIRKLKLDTLYLFEAGIVDNLSQAAIKLGVPKTRMYSWFRADPEWKMAVQCFRDVKADELEEQLDSMKNVVGIIFRLKMLRPEYRDNAKSSVQSDKMQQLMQELVEIGRKSVKESANSRTEGADLEKNRV